MTDKLIERLEKPFLTRLADVTISNAAFAICEEIELERAEAFDALQAAQKEIEREREELRRALEPFALAVSELDPGFKDKWPVLIVIEQKGWKVVIDGPIIGDLRRARAEIERLTKVITCS